MKKKIISLGVVAALVLAMFSGITTIASATDTVGSGLCGEEVTWSLTANGLLTISGTGEMYDYGDMAIWGDMIVPWNCYCEAITKVVIEDGVTSIGSHAFSGCVNLASIDIPNTIVTIGDYVFVNCVNLKSVVIPDSVISIGDGEGGNTFRFCESLTNITLGRNLTTLGSAVFFGCKRLKSITIPANVSSIHSNTFGMCNSLTDIMVEERNQWYTSIAGVLFDKEVTTVIKYPSGKAQKSYALPEGVISIGDDAFSYSSLYSVSLPDSLTSIGAKAFWACKSLWNIVIPNKVLSIADDAFAYCSNLESITIPDSIGNIGDGAFTYCNCLSDVYYAGVESQWSNIVIGDDNSCLTDAYIHYGFSENSQQSDVANNEHAYIPVIRNVIDYLRSTYGRIDGYGILYDVDDNGVDELVMMYSAELTNNEAGWLPVTVYSVYSMCENKAVPLIDQEVLYVNVGGPTGYVAIAERDGKKCIVSTSENGEVGPISYRGGNWTVLTVDGTSVSRETEISYEEVYSYEKDTVLYDRSYAVINGTQCDYRTLEAWIDELSILVSIDPYATQPDKNVMTLQELLDYLHKTPVDKEEHSKESSIIVYSDYTNLSIRKGSTITLSAGIIAGGKPADDISGITFQIEDTSILSVVTTDTKDSFRYVKLKGLAEGTTTVIFNDSNTGSVVKIPITVYDNNYLSYTLSNVPTQQIEKYATNFYNVNGLYIDSYEYAVSDDQSATVSFDVYNSNYSYGAVEVLDENGTLIDAVLIDKMDSSLTGIKEAVLDNLAYLVRDIFQGDLLTYRQESGFSKMTSVSVKVPKNGYIKICTDPDNSSIVGLVNYADLLLSLLEFSGEITGFGTKSEEFADKLTAKVINEKIFAELVGDRDKMAQKLWKNIGKEALITSDAMGSFVDTAINNLSEFGLLDVVLSTASDCGWNIGEKVFTDLSGPFGVALKAIFTIGKAENIIIQYHDVTHSAGLGSIIIQNQGGGIRSCQQIKVECEDGFADDTALNVFCVTLEADVLDIIEKYNPDIYGQIVNGVTYTYNISLMKDGSETQPNGEVTVYIPIPDELKALAYAGDWIDGVPVKVKIYRIEEDGTLTEMDVRIEDGCFVFTTNHFSLYTIVGYDSVDDTTPNQNENSLSIIAIIGIVAVVIVGAGAIVIIKRRKNESH